MAGPALFQRVVAALFGPEPPVDAAEQRLVEELTDLVVDTVEPKLRAHRRYRQKLDGCMRATMAHVRSIARTRLQPLELTRAHWGDDPRLNAFFARAEDVAEFLGRSRELRAFFEDQPSADEAWALMGMKKDEKSFFGPREEQGVLRQDVAQTAVSFSGHKLVDPSVTEQEMLQAVGRRIVLRLAQVALASVVALDERAADLEQRKAYLYTRLRFLKLAQDGMEGILDLPADLDAQIVALQRELNETVKGFIEAKSSVATLDSTLDLVEEVFAHPERHVVLARSELRVSRTGIKLEAGADQPHNALTVAELRIGDRVQAVIAFVRVPRSEMPAQRDLLAQAERFL